MERKINILIIRNAEFEKNASMKRMANALYKNNKVIIIDRKDQRNNSSENKNINSIILKRKRGRGLKNIGNLIAYQLKLLIMLIKKRKDVDIIHVFDFDSAVPVRLFSFVFKRKYTYHIADFYIDSRKGLPEFAKKIVKFFDYGIISAAEATIICTEDRINQIKGSKPNKLLTIHNTPSFLNKERQLMRTEEKSKTLKIAYIGTLSHDRFIMEAIEAVSELSFCHLTIGGIGPLEKVVYEKSKEYKNITYLGPIEYQKTYSVYKEADLMFAIYNPKIKNHVYAAPNKFYEALYFGKPIIMAYNTGLSDLVNKNNIGYLINYSKEEFKEKLFEIYENQNQMHEYGRNSYELYEEFSLEKMSRRINNYYNDVRNGGSNEKKYL